MAVGIAVCPEPPHDDDDEQSQYEDAVEGGASVLGGDARPQEVTPPWPGRSGLTSRCAAATSTDGTGGDERVSITLWAAPFAPERT